MSLDLDSFLTWFRSAGGTLHPSVSFKTFTDSEGGRGAVALTDIDENTVLFTIPREMTLSLRTSSLPVRFGNEEWIGAGLNRGWAGLILCMLWETTNDRWAPYLDSLPTNFETPMFWEESEIAELKGTAVPDKIGRADAERDYHEKVVPAMRSRPDLFPADKIDNQYALHAYHIMGSRILSRSFHVERWEGEDQDEENENAGDVSMESRKSDVMQVDDEGPPHGVDEEADSHSNGDEGEGEEEEEEDPSDVAMVPMADLLNARYNAGNAKLFYESKDLRMQATNPIKAGEQIWNTYGDPPNSDLLRRYGHVDEIPLSDEQGGGTGNPNDIVELRADLIVELLQPEEAKERIEWWLDEGGDDVFVLGYELVPPPELLSLTRLLLLPLSEYQSARSKGKLPKPKSTTDVVDVLISVFRRRLEEYPTTIEEDESLLTSLSAESSTGMRNKRNAVVVRLGEKRILRKTIEHAEDAKRRAGSEKGKKRDRDVDDSDVKRKKSKR
ncbi:SET domain-containing protein [Flagelloscypha sp. PMI_526]|nr:SET domain-containing protein [Flagelloscypha sp. PMI_526]